MILKSCDSLKMNMICSYLYSLIKCSAFRKGDPFLLSDTAASADTNVSQLLLFQVRLSSVSLWIALGGGRGGGNFAVCAIRAEADVILFVVHC